MDIEVIKKIFIKIKNNENTIASIIGIFIIMFFIRIDFYDGSRLPTEYSLINIRSPLIENDEIRSQLLINENLFRRNIITITNNFVGDNANMKFDTGVLNKLILLEIKQKITEQKNKIPPPSMSFKAFLICLKGIEVSYSVNTKKLEKLLLPANKKENINNILLTGDYIDVDFQYEKELVFNGYSLIFCIWPVLIFAIAFTLDRDKVRSKPNSVNLSLTNNINNNKERINKDLKGFLEDTFKRDAVEIKRRSDIFLSISLILIIIGISYHYLRETQNVPFITILLTIIILFFTQSMRLYNQYIRSNKLLQLCQLSQEEDLHKLIDLLKVLAQKDIDSKEKNEINSNLKDSLNILIEGLKNK